MKRPIQAGDMAEVISGLLGAASPNVGLIVSVVACVGEHSQHGRIWRCQAEFAERGQVGTDKVVGGQHDFAQAWLRKIEGPKAPDKTESKTLEKIE